MSGDFLLFKKNYALKKPLISKRIPVFIMASNQYSKQSRDAGNKVFY